MTEQTTHFGFKTVNEDEKETLVRNVFDSVASKYDLMNDLMSLGIHRLWKDGLIEWLNPRPDMRLLDVGGGTGDIAFRFLKRGGGSVMVSDINPNMLEVGKKRALDKGIVENIEWQVADVEKLPFDDNSFDAVTIAFCIRNVTHPEQGLREMYRVLKPGGRFLCLEFSQVTTAGLDKLYDWWSFNALPEIGEKIAKDRDSYQYLAESIRNFPTQEVWAQKMRMAGFAQVKYRNFSHGIAALHSGWKF